MSGIGESEGSAEQSVLPSLLYLWFIRDESIEEPGMTLQQAIYDLNRSMNTSMKIVTDNLQNLNDALRKAGLGA